MSLNIVIPRTMTVLQLCLDLFVTLSSLIIRQSLTSQSGKNLLANRFLPLQK